MKKYEGNLELKFLDSQEVSEGIEADSEEVLRSQMNAYHILSDNVKEIKIEGWGSNTSLEKGYIETLDFSVESNLNLEELRKKLSKLRLTIDYCNSIDIMEI